MPVLTTQISPDGPVVLLAIFVSKPRSEALAAAGHPIPQAQIIRGLIDTGASATVLDSAVIRALALMPTGTAQIHTPSTGSTPHTCNQYDVALAVVMDPSLAIHVVSVTIPILGANLSHQGYQALVGRDVLSSGALWYNGRGGSLSLAF